MTTLLVDSFSSHNGFDCSVTHTWDTDKRKAVIGGINVPQMWHEYLPEKKKLNSNWLNAEKECGSVLRSHLWGGHKERLCSSLTFCQDKRKLNVLNSRPFPCSVLTPYSVLPCQNVWTYVR